MRAWVRECVRMGGFSDDWRVYSAHNTPGSRTHTPIHTRTPNQTVVTRGPAGALWKGQWRGQAVAVKMITAAAPPAPSPSSALGAAGGPASPRQVWWCVCLC